MDSSIFTPIQLDALKEVSNIGAGNAATSLSLILGHKVDMNVPSVNMVKLNDIYEVAGEKEVYGIILRVLGDIQGNILIIFEKELAEKIIEGLSGMREEKISEIGISVLSEIGNIMSAGYMNSISEFTGLSISQSVPAVAYDMLSAIIGTVFLESYQYDEYILDIETRFKDSSERDFGINFYYIPVPGSLEKMLKKIGLN
ncbi:chemotaxis protein CheC [Clostridium thermobutyricum]|uniref:CheY-P phosphatase CheC n=1 Tax=Clostridium thermobutyricum DSM 4928 TaxID=1121339 RepID=A0A1V4SN73_9CLOT|nr:chemotaxis protein CheC [Clostridium thermobutyricum]OPX45348.1 CheY-P phosphatase CheC [Clostridium thermobutyricum DSM 4928]